MISHFSSTRCALAALTALALTGASACGSSGHSGGQIQAQARQSVQAQAQQSAARDRAAPKPRPPVIRAGRTIRSFTGIGNRAIGSLSERRPIVLQWSTSGQRIQLFTAQGFLLLDSHVPTGRVRLAPGDYLRLRVASRARWTLLLRTSA